MPFFLIAVGLVMIAAAINDKQVELGELWKEQFTGPQSFLSIALVFFLLGALGAVTNLRPLAVAFMGLILLVMFLSNAGTSESINFISRLRAQMLGGSTP
jgi:hypothetical protein